MAKKFHLGDILTITTGRLVSPRHMDGVYDILNFMTGDNLFTHQLPRAADECKPWLVRQHPQLREVTGEGCGDTKETVAAWLAGQVEMFGEQLDVEPVPDGHHVERDPIEEAEELVGADKVIVVQVPEGEGNGLS